MRKSDAKKILSGELVARGDYGVLLTGKYGGNYKDIIVSTDEMTFCLRQLALKVEREKGK